MKMSKILLNIKKSKKIKIFVENCKKKGGVFAIFYRKSNKIFAISTNLNYSTAISKVSSKISKVTNHFPTNFHEIHSQNKITLKTPLIKCDVTDLNTHQSPTPLKTDKHTIKLICTSIDNQE